MTELRLRRLRTDDLEVLTGLEESCFDHPWSRTAILQELRLPSSLGIGLGNPVESASLFAYALFRRVLDEAELARLAVAADRRRRGLADVLLSGALGHLRRVGTRTVHLEVRASNLPALGLYGKHGFATVGCRPDYYPDGCDALLMSLAVDGARAPQATPRRAPGAP